MALTVHAQSAILSGKVTDADGQPVTGALIYWSGAKEAVHSDSAGRYQLLLPYGKITLVVHLLAYEKQEVIIDITGPNHTLDFQLTEKDDAQHEVVIKGKTGNQLLKEQPVTISVLDAEAYHHQSVSKTDLLSRLPGIRVRQDGGLGSQARFSINGISGKQVRFFIDGVPLEFYGGGLGMHAVPVQFMERVEIYKGTVPIHLGADALGGAFNVVTRKEKKDYLDLGFSYGSFNTHKASFSGRYSPGKKGIYLGISAFYNYSDNNYKVDVEIPDAFGTPRKATVRRFHDRFSNQLLRGEIGWLGKNGKDLVAAYVTGTGIRDDIQHNALMTQPYGKATYSEAAIGAGIRFVKKDLILKNTELEGFAGITASRSVLVDTSLDAYTWNGEVFNRRQYGGEINTSRNLLTLKTEQFLSRISFSFLPFRNHRLTLSYLIHSYFRKGHDPVAALYYGKDLFANPNSYLKQVSGISYQVSFWRSKIVSISSVKHFSFNSLGFSTDNTREIVPASSSNRQTGFNQAVKVHFGPFFFLRGSYEYAARLPDETELFGNYYLIRPNASLVPETSHNTNAGFVYDHKWIRAEVNCFHQKVDNIIYLRTSQFFSQYQNLLKADIKGLEGEVTLKPADFLQFNVNATYQDLRNRTAGDKTGTISDRYLNARLPNIPYFFANGEARFSEKFSRKGHQIQFWWNVQYVHEFFLYWAVDGRRESKAVIPSQWLHHSGLSLSLPENQITFSFEVLNLTDTKAYDNFNVQKPGIHYAARIRFYLTGNKS